MVTEPKTLAAALAPLSEGKVGKKSTLDLIFEALPAIEAAIHAGNSYAVITEHLRSAELDLSPKLLAMYVSRARKRRERLSSRGLGRAAVGLRPATPAPASPARPALPSSPAAAGQSTAPSLARPPGVIAPHEIDFNDLR